jgi:hypothetical protein
MMKKIARPCVPKRVDVGLSQVASDDNTYEISLENRTCSCRKWDLYGLTCNHVVSAIYKARNHPEDFVSDFFKKTMYLNNYRPFFMAGPKLTLET